MTIQKMALGALLAGLMLGSWMSVSASDASSGDNSYPSNGSKCNDAAKERIKAMIQKYLAKLKTEDPAEYARLMELRETDREAFRAEMKKLLKAEYAKRKHSSEGKSYASGGSSSGSSSGSGASSSSSSGSSNVSKTLGEPIDLRR